MLNPNATFGYSNYEVIIMQEIIEIISTVGFPIAVCVYLLYERDRRTKELTDVIRDLGEYVRNLKE